MSTDRIESLRQRFWDHVDASDEDGCWPWTLRPDGNGYGQLRAWGNVNLRAHRLSYLLNVGEIQDDMVVMHVCDNRICVRPDHLALGTRADNLADCRAKGRWTNRPKAPRERRGRRGPIPRPVAERLWEKVEIGPPGSCWLFVGKRDAGGYGLLSDGTRRVRAHRVAYEDKVGEIADGLIVMHSCDNPPCCNPEHLFLGTRGDNNRDRARKGRGRENRQGGEANLRARLTQEEADDIRRLWSEGMSQTEIATRFAVQQPQVSKIVRGVSWRE